MSTSVTHVIGAGLAGLSAAVGLARTGAKVIVHEATAQAGGRCRSYYDHSLGMVIDNGNHLLLSGNHAALGFIRAIGGQHAAQGARTCGISLRRSRDRRALELRPNDGRLPWWIFSAERRVPGTSALDYLGMLRLLRPPAGATISAVMTCSGTLYDRLLHPLLLAALNTDPPQADAGLAAAVIRETLALGAACLPAADRPRRTVGRLSIRRSPSCSSRAPESLSSTICMRSDSRGDGSRRSISARRWWSSRQTTPWYSQCRR